MPQGHPQPISTYSIVARDPDTGQMGVAVQSHYFSVGSLAPSAVAGVGVAVAQSFPKIVYGSTVLDYLRAGRGAEEALQSVLADDPAPDYRQMALVDTRGEVAVHTGRCCVAEAGHHLGEQYSCQANMMLKDTVWQAMAEAFETHSGGLDERLLHALEAAESEQGDVRGCQSAALMVVAPVAAGNPLHDSLVDLRVEDNPQPLQELKRLLNMKNAYQHNGLGDAYLARKEFDKALEEFSRADALLPGNAELMFWRAVALINAGDADEALPYLSQVLTKNANWAILMRRLVEAGLLPDDPAAIDAIIRRAESRPPS